MYDNTVAPDIAIGAEIGADNMVLTIDADIGADNGADIGADIGADNMVQTMVHVAESPEARVCHQLGKTCLTMSDNTITSFLDTV